MRNPWSWVTEERLTYAVKLLLAIVLVLYLGAIAIAFLERILGLVYILVGAIFLAYLVYPLVRRLNSRMPLGLAIASVYLGFAVVVAIVLWLVLPGLSSDVRAAIQNAPAFSAAFSNYINDPNNPLLARLPADVRIPLVRLPDTLLLWLRAHGMETAGHAFGVVRGAFTIVATFVIIPLLSAYLLADVDRMRSALHRLVPEDRWPGTQSFLAEIDTVVGGFIRGQLIVGGTIGGLLTIALLILHVPYAFLLGLAAAIGDLVPLVGAVLTFIPAVAIAYVANGWVNAAIVAVIFTTIFQLEGHVISPMIVSSQVKLSPLIVLVAVLIGADLGGIFGMLVAVPIAGVLRVVVLRMIAPQARVNAGVPAKEEAP